MHEPFLGIEEAQTALDAWRQQDNADRPHQSLAMAFPAARFASATGEILGLRMPAELAASGPPAAHVNPAAATASVMLDASGKGQERTVELDRVVPPSRNLWLAGQQIWLARQR